MGRTMLEKLKEDYERSVKQDNKGHAIGFFRNGEEIQARYHFDKGAYTLRSVSEEFIWWDYEGD